MINADFPLLRVVWQANPRKHAHEPAIQRRACCLKPADLSAILFWHTAGGEAAKNPKCLSYCRDTAIEGILHRLADGQAWRALASARGSDLHLALALLRPGMSTRPFSALLTSPSKCQSLHTEQVCMDEAGPRGSGGALGGYAQRLHWPHCLAIHAVGRNGISAGLSGQFSRLSAHWQIQVGSHGGRLHV